MYPGWRDVVYPTGLPTGRWFGHYASLFDTVELNTTFYRLPAESTVDGWAAQAPPNFLYAVKLGRFGTHRKKLLDPAPWLARHLERTTRLGDHMGPHLVQLPPRWRRDTPRLDDFLAAAPTSVRWAVEVRDPTWLHDDVFDVLHRHGAALCIHDLLADHPWERTAGWTYLRFHGPQAVDRAYAGRYGGHRLARVAARLEGWLAEGTDVFAYFNNDQEGHAVADAAWLASRLAPTGAGA
jgi:uncharacterized protein YecE (DUF72 family)